MDIIQFLKPEEFKKLTASEMNIDDNKILPSIYDAQYDYLLPTLGQTFYDELGNIAIAGGTFSSDQLYLIGNFIKPMLAQYTLYLCLTDLNYKMTNKSLTKESSQYGQPSDYRELVSKMNKVIRRAQTINLNLISYLNQNQSLFPNYGVINTGDFVLPYWPGYDVGVFIPNSRSCRCFGSCRCGGNRYHF